jgi:hypothetical protein
MSFMVGAKLITIQLPFLFRDLIDNFGAEVAKVSAAAAEESSASGGVDTMATATGGLHLVQVMEMSESAVHALNTMMTEPSEYVEEKVDSTGGKDNSRQPPFLRTGSLFWMS